MIFFIITIGIDAIWNQSCKLHKFLAGLLALLEYLDRATSGLQQFICGKSLIHNFILISWRGSFVGKKRKKIWKSIPLCIFWTVWKERNRLAFRGGALNIQKLKNYFVCNLWNWAKVYLGEESFSLIGLLEWIAST